MSTRNTSSRNRRAALPIRGVGLPIEILVTAFAALLMLGCGAAPSDSDKAAIVPLKSMYATVPHDGIKKVVLDDQLDADLLESFFRFGPKTSNVFLTNAKDLRGAVEAAVHFRGYSEFRLPASSDSSQPWLVVFFGFSQTEPCEWNVKSVRCGESKIVVDYAQPPKGLQRTRNSYPYFILVPLEALKAGPYQLELRDAVSTEAVLVRRIRALPAQR